MMKFSTILFFLYFFLVRFVFDIFVIIALFYRNIQIVEIVFFFKFTKSFLILVYLHKIVIIIVKKIISNHFHFRILRIFRARELFDELLQFFH